MAISAFDIYLGYSNQTTLGTPVAQRLRALRRVGFFFLICGASLRAWAMQTLGRFFTFRLAVRKEHKVIRTGPFAFVRFVVSCLQTHKISFGWDSLIFATYRHPSYTGALAMVLGEFLLLLSGNVGQRYFATGSLSSQTIISIPLTITALSCIPIVPRIKKEEKMLWEALGDEWRKYTSEVKWRLLPGIF